jgi:hypothetical protein
MWCDKMSSENCFAIAFVGDLAALTLQMFSK